jgi:hypothetical protein
VRVDVKARQISRDRLVVGFANWFHIESKEKQIFSGDAPHESSKAVRPASYAGIAGVVFKPVSWRARNEESDWACPNRILLWSEKSLHEELDVSEG